MRTLLFNLLTFVLISLTLSFSQNAVAQTWMRQINGAINGDDHAYDVEFNSQGDVFAVGDIENDPDAKDFTVAKMCGTTGEVLWRRDLFGTSRDFDSIGRALDIDSNGNPVAAGFVNNTTTLQDFTVVKLNGETGAVVWRVELNGTFNDFDKAHAIAVDAQNNVIAGGYVINGSGFFPVNNFTVVKINGANGQIIWRREINLNAVIRTQANAVRVDAEGNVFAAGSIATPNTGENFIVIKFDGATGNTIWQKILNENNQPLITSAAYDLALDSRGDPVAVGSLYNSATSYDFAVVKFDRATGAVLWRREINGAANNFDIATAVAVDFQNNVVAVGGLRNRNPNQFDMAVVKLNGTNGEVEWQRSIGVLGPNYAEAVVIKDAPRQFSFSVRRKRSRIFVAGRIFTENQASNFAVVEFANASGAEVQRTVFDGDDNWHDNASDIALNPRGNLVAVGNIVNIATSSDFAVLRLR